MGSRLSSRRLAEQEAQNSLDEEEDQQETGGSDGDSPAPATVRPRQRRRRSSGLSRYSTDERHVVEAPLRIGAFNVRRFGTAKMNDAAVVRILVRLVRRFDILVVQEVVDTSNKAVNQLLEAVNDKSGGDTDGGGGYEVVVSPRLGRSSQKEQYAIFYRTGRLQLQESLVYDDPRDEFIREPFIARFRSECVVASAAEFTLIAIHTQPKEAVKEIDLLVDVHQFVRDRLGAENIILLGDFNAGGSYVRSQDWARIRLRERRDFHWLIPDHMDTTATNTLAAYDRIVVWGENLMSAIVKDSPGVYRYDEELSVEEAAMLKVWSLRGRRSRNKVSDHYPVSFCLKPALHPHLAKNIRSRLRIVVQDRRFPPALTQAKMLEDFRIPKKYKLRTLHDSEGEPVLLELRSHKLPTAAAVVEAIGALRSSFDEFITYSQYATIKYKLESGDVRDASLNGQEPAAFHILVTADLQLKEFHCSVEMETGVA